MLGRMSIEAQIIEFISERDTNPGETIEYGWFIFQVGGTSDSPIVQTLDFKELASFTTDFSAVDQIHAQQMRTATDTCAEPCWCNLRQFATISKSYVHSSNEIFMQRLSTSEGNDSGWYVGVIDDPVDVNDPDHLTLKSLYELTIDDARLAPFWLLPVGYTVYFEGPNSRVEAA